MALILAIQPDSAQSGPLRQALCGSADVVVVDSVDAALAAIDSRVPDLVLVGALTPPSEIDDLIAYLRVLPDTDHVQTIGVPLIQRQAERKPSSQVNRRLRWLSQLIKDPPRSWGKTAGCDPDLFASDVAEYLARTHAVRSEAALRKAADQRWTTERRRATRLLAPDLPFVAARLTTDRADVINISAGGALIRTDVRPVPGRGVVRDPLFGPVLTLLQSSGQEIRQAGRPLRCNVRPIGGGRILYEVAFAFDEALAIALQGLESSSTAPSEALGHGDKDLATTRR